jgi:hypothetical protein
MGSHIDHIGIGTRNLYEAAFRLRAETGLGFYDGGLSGGVTASMIFPLGGVNYIQMSALVDPKVLEDPKNTAAIDRYKQVKDADRFTGVELRADTMDDLKKIADAHGGKLTDLAMARLQLDGSWVHVAGVAIPNVPKGMPGWNVFLDMNTHPSGHPVEPAPGLVKPLGISWVEVGGTEADLSKWIGEPAASLGFRFNGKPTGIYGFGVKTEKGEIVIRRKALDEA